MDARGRTSAEEEKALAARIAKGEKAAIDELVLRNGGLAWHVAKRYSNAVDVEDAVQEGMLGLYDAAVKFKADAGTRFGTYAMFHIRHRINDYVCEMGAPMALSHGPPGSILLGEERIKRKLESRGIEPTEEAVAKAAHVHVNTLRTVRALKRAPRSFDAPIGGEDGDRTLAEVLPLDQQTAEEQVASEEEAIQVRNALALLPDRMRHVIERRFAHDENLREIGEGLNLSRERVRQIEADGLELLRVEFERQPSGVIRYPEIMETTSAPAAEEKLEPEKRWISRGQTRSILGLGIDRINQLVREGRLVARATEDGVREFEEASVLAYERQPTRSSIVLPRSAPSAQDWVGMGEATRMLGVSGQMVCRIAREGRIERLRSENKWSYGVASLRAYMRTRKERNDAGASKRADVYVLPLKEPSGTTSAVVEAMLTRDQVAERLHCSMWNVHNLARRRDLNPVKQNGQTLYPAAEVEAYATRPRVVSATKARTEPKPEPTQAGQVVEAAERAARARVEIDRLNAELAEAQKALDAACAEVVSLAQRMRASK